MSRHKAAGFHTALKCTGSICVAKVSPGVLDCAQKPRPLAADRGNLLVFINMNYMSLRRRGRHHVRTTIGLVAAVLAVGVSVTPPLLVNALSGATLHLAGGALRRGGWVSTTTGRRLI